MGLATSAPQPARQATTAAWLACHWKRAAGILLLVVAGLLARLPLAGRSIGIDDVYTLSSVTGHSLDVHLSGMAADESWADPDGPRPAGSFRTYIQPRAGNSLAGVARDVHAGETHPPLFYLLLYAWMKAAGFGFDSGRAFSILMGLAAIPVLFLLAREMAGERAAWFACGLLALAPFQAQLAMQVRMYTLAALLSLLATWLAWRMLQRGATRGGAILFFAVSAAGLYSHYYFVLYTAFHGLCLIVRRQWKAALALAVAFATIGVPLGIYLATQVDMQAQRWMSGSREVSELIVTAGLAFSDFVLLVPGAWLPFWLPAAIVPAAKLLYVAFLGVLLLIAALSVPQSCRTQESNTRSALVFLLGWLAVPALLLVAFDLVRHTGTFVHTRYLFGASPALYILLGIGLARLRACMRLAFSALLVVALAANHVGMARLAVGELIEGADFERASHLIAGRWQPGDLVVVHTSYPQTPISLGYYLPPETPVLSLVYNTRGERGALTARPDQRDIPARMDRHASGAPRLWVIRAFTNVNYEELDSWLRARYAPVRADRYGALILRELRQREK